MTPEELAIQNLETEINDRLRILELEYGLTVDDIYVSKSNGFYDVVINVG